ncbi:MAG TPA: V4R domain-containing protein [Gemmatimonadaceae bacterium]|nr:V4R domain-containing protein [Gemmatimonadaceae bacterium]
MDHQPDSGHAIPLAPNAMVAMTRDSLLALRDSLFRDLGITAASYLQDAGYAGAAPVYEAFARWLATRGYESPERVGAAAFGAEASAFFAEAGWGSLELGNLGHGVATLDSNDWAEADPAHALEFPGCYYTAGVLSDFFSRLADGPVAVMEVECRSMGTERCRFLVGGPDVMQRVYDDMGRGVGYQEAISGAPAE